MMRIPQRRISELALCAITTFALANSANAVIVVNNSKNVAPAGGAVHAAHDPSSSGTPNLLSASVSDLAQGLTGTITYTGGTGNVMNEQSAGVIAWTNGSLATVYGENGGGGDLIDHAAYGVVTATPTIDSFVTFNLGALYDLTRVDVFTGWNDSGRDDASFILRASTDGVNFANLFTYTKGPDDTGAITVPVTNLHSVVDGAAADLAPAIQYVQLQFTDADNGYAGLVEVDVFGEAPTFDIADANRDGEVDIDDFYEISNNFLTVPSGLGLDGDIVADNFVDAADFRLWKDSVSPALLAQVNGLSVPEPAAVMTLAMSTALGLLVYRRRQA